MKFTITEYELKQIISFGYGAGVVAERYPEDKEKFIELAYEKAVSLVDKSEIAQ